jgi:hypothetical protein
MAPDIYCRLRLAEYATFVDVSGLGSVILMFVYLNHADTRHPSLKQVYLSIPASRNGIRKTISKLVSAGYLRIVDDSDKRIKKLSVTFKFTDSFEAFLSAQERRLKI